MKKTWMIIGSIGIGLTGLILFLGNQPEPVPAIQLRRDNVIATLTVTGEVKGDTTVNLSPPVTARITTITVDEGAPVKPGQLLIQLESDTQRAQWEQAQAQAQQSWEIYLNLKQGTRPEEILYRKERLAEMERRIEESQVLLTLAQTQLQDALKTAKRYQELYRQELISAQEFDNAQLQVDTNRQKVEQAKAALQAVKIQREQAQAQLTQAKNGPTRPELASALAAAKAAEDNAQAARAQIQLYQLRSPLAGWVINRAREPGDLGRPGEAILTLVNPHTLEVVCSVEENDLAKVKPQDTAYVVLDAFPELALKGRIKRIARQVNPDNGTVDAHVTLLDSEWPKLKGIGLLPGMTADVSILTRRLKQALILPATAVQKDGGAWYVYRFDQNRLKKQLVAGERISMENFQVTGGLSAGDWVANQANEALQSKKNVRPVSANTNNPSP